MLTFALIEGNSLGIMFPPILAAYAGSVLFFLFLLWRERATRHPMLQLKLFQERTFSATNVVAVCQTFTFTGFIFVISLFLQQVKHDSPSLTGLALLPSLLWLCPPGDLALQHAHAPYWGETRDGHGSVPLSFGLFWVRAGR